jgi:TP901 family phage tail tape measure protein
MNVGEIRGTLTAVFDDRGFQRFDAAMSSSRRQARDAIKAQLGGQFNDQAFTRYNEAANRAERRARDREVFKAQLGGNFNASAFNQYERQLNQSQKTHSTFTKNVEANNNRIHASFSKLAGAATIVAGTSLGIVALGKSSLGAAVSFEKAMLLVHTQAGYAEGDVKRLTQAVLDMAPKVGFGPQELATALFHIASAGVPASQAMNVLTAAAKGARVGAADLEQTTNALVGIMRTAPKDVKGASDAMSTLSNIVGQGNLRMDDLTAALSTGVLPAAKIFGLGLKDVGAAIDVMTARGMQAEQGATRLRMTFSLMAAPTEKAAGALGSIGLKSDQLANDMRKPGGLVIALTDLKKHLENSGLSATQQAAVLSKAFGGGRTSAGIMLLVQNIGDLKKRTDALGQQTGTKQLDDAFAKTQKDAAANIERLKASLQTTGIQIGHALEPMLPVLVQGAQRFGAFIQQIRDGRGAGGDFAHAVSDAFQTVRSVVQTIISAFGGLRNTLTALATVWVATKVLAFAAAIKAVGAALIALRANPIGLVLTGLALLAAAFFRVDGSQKAARMSAKQVADAWRDAKDAARNLQDAGLRQRQAQLDLVNAQNRARATQIALNNAVRDYGRNSPQVRQATLDNRQAQLDLQRAQVEARRSTEDLKKAQDDKRGSDSKAATALGTTEKHVKSLTDAQARKIQSDQQEAIQLGNQIDQMVKAHAPAEAIRAKQDQLRQVVARLAQEQSGLNTNLRNMPKNVSSNVSVKINWVSDMTGAINSLATGVAKGIIGKFAVGGMVNRPMMIVGEEAPQHPEVVLATNPRYRQRNLELWLVAGRMLGIPGFAAGGATDAAMAGGIDPWTQKVGGQWGSRVGGQWSNKIRNQLSNLGGGAGGVSGSPPAGGVPGSVAEWLQAAMALAGVGGSLWLRMLERQVMRESGGDPHNINLWDINAQQGHPSKGLLQTIDPTFNAYSIGGHKDIWNPVDNAIAAIRYMIARYGGGDANRALQVMIGRGGGGYARGGILGRIPRFQTGGINWTAQHLEQVPGGGGGGGTSVGGIIGEPGLPRLGGGTPGTLAGAGTVAGNISANRSQIAQLEHDYSTLDSFYSLKEEELVNPDTGDVNETAVKRRVAQLNQLWNIRWRIHYVWGYVVARTKRLIAAYQGIIRRLTRAANAIRTRGLKGNALSSAQKHQSDLRSTITDTQGKLSSARGDLTSAQNDRESSWIDVLRLGGERDSVANTQPEKHDQTPEPDLGGGSADVGAGGGGATAPSPAEIAAAALEQLRGFQSARADLFASFGSNVARAGANPFATATQQAAGMSYFGAASGPAPGAVRGGIVINNTFQEPPADAHTWAHQQRFAVETAF